MSRKKAEHKPILHKLDQAIMTFQIANNISVEAVLAPGMEQLCNALMEAGRLTRHNDSYGAPDRATYMSALTERYQKCVEMVKDRLHSPKIPGLISLTKDAWSKQGLGFITVVAKWIEWSVDPVNADEHAREIDVLVAESANLGLLPMRQRHTGINLSKRLNHVLLHSFSLSHSAIFCCTTDHASNEIASLQSNPGRKIFWHGCKIHALQTVVRKLMALPIFGQLLARFRAMTSYLRNSPIASALLQDLKVQLKPESWKKYQALLQSSELSVEQMEKSCVRLFMSGQQTRRIRIKQVLITR